MATLKETLERLTATGEVLVREDGKIRCLACGHRCRIPEGQAGICKVRYVKDDTLHVPSGYVGAIHCDPVEKKPFFHALPGSQALTFGMLGCDLHCAYCFTGDTVITTTRGPRTISEIFAASACVTATDDGDIGYPKDVHVVTASGNVRPVRAAFRHNYRGELLTIRPYYLPTLTCTPDHRVYATDDPAREPSLVPAAQLTTRHFLAVPRHHRFFDRVSIDAFEELEHVQVTHRVPWKLSPEQRSFIAHASANGTSSRTIALTLATSASYIRHVRSKIAHGRALDTRTSKLLIEGDRIRFRKEHRPGVPRSIPLDEMLARLLGLYCAEGSVTSSKERPNSHSLSFSFAPHEHRLVDEVVGSLAHCFGVRGVPVQRSTTMAVAAGKNALALLFKALAGSGARGKHVPQAILEATREATRAFLDGVIDGDGHRYANGKVSVTTVSRSLAYGIAWLALKLGYLPSLYTKSTPGPTIIQGRRVNRAENQYTVVWYEREEVSRKCVRLADHHLVPIREVTPIPSEGPVYNLEVDEEHSYLAGFCEVSNCQNWLTSQALRDPAALAPPIVISAARIVELALERGARLVVSSYNEPLITSEWAVEVFREARAAGLTTAFVSNGNGTREVLTYLRPWVDLYKVDLKSFRDKSYRSLGGLLENVQRTIQMLVEMKFWVEIVTLVIPGFNDTDDELSEMARFLASVSPDLPWHVTGFHQDYRMTDPDDTPVETLLRAAKIGREAGLRFVYAGNRPGKVGNLENTYCPACATLLVERRGFHVLRNDVRDGSCPSCRARIPGVWC